MNILMAHNYYVIGGGEDISYQSEKSMLERGGNFVISYEAHSSKILKDRKLKNALNSIWNQRSYNDLSHIISSNNIEIAHFQNIFPIISPSAYYAAKNSGAQVIQSLRNYRITCINGLMFREDDICMLCVGKSLPLNGIVHRCYKKDVAASTIMAVSSQIHASLGTYRKVIDKYIAVSEFVKDIYVSAGISASKIFVKPNVVMGEMQVGAGSGNYFLYVGRLSEEKGIIQLIESFIKNDNFYPLKIIGDGPISERVIEMCRKTSSIEYLGRMPAEKVYKFMGDARAVIVPSLWHEPFGRVVIESYAVGTPVIGSRKGGITELIRHGQTGILYEGDYNSISSAISEFLGTTEKYNNMRDLCRQEYEKYYSESANYEILKKIYDK